MALKKIAVVLSGGELALKHAEDNMSRVQTHGGKLVAIADASEGARQKYAGLIESGVKFFGDIHEMYENMNIDLTVIASHAGLHSMHASTAMEQGSDVFVLKPLAGTLDDMNEIIHMSKVTGKRILVGYESLYDDTIHKIKEIIYSGYLGGLIDMKMICLHKKSELYFSEEFRGKFYDANKRIINHSVLSESCVNHLMNLFYIAGEDMSSISKVATYNAVTAKTCDIETYDTCAIKGELTGGVGILAVLTDAAIHEKVQYMLWFERGYIEFVKGKWKIYLEGTYGTEEIGNMEHDYLIPLTDMMDKMDEKGYFPDKLYNSCAKQHIKLMEELNKADTLLVDDVKELEHKLDQAYANYSLPFFN